MFHTATNYDEARYEKYIFHADGNNIQDAINRGLYTSAYIKQAEATGYVPFITALCNDLGDYMDIYFNDAVGLKTLRTMDQLPVTDYNIMFIAKLIGDGLFEEYESHTRFRVSCTFKLTNGFIDIEPA